ncbi:MAG: putative collagen-binding domain-containing protein [Candidatus Bathyarchaeia archaeon]
MGEVGCLKGSLHVNLKNPRYFTDDDERAIYLTGSHTWNNLQDMGITDPPSPFDFSAYLDFLQRYNHNFIRLWRWEMPKYRYNLARPFSFSQPHPWKRTGPGLARDGKPKFNLHVFDESYFQRLRSRVEMAAERGIYVSIMLFEGHCAQFTVQGWEFHPFHPDNNVNTVDGGRLDYYTLKNKRVLTLQEDYVRRVIDTVNEFDNVLYEVCNEAGNYSTEWQYYFIRFVKSYEVEMPKQHPVGMTFQYGGERSGTNADLFSSPADWISPNPEYGYREDPPVNDGRKVVLNDTDHLWGEGGNPQWVWKSFTRGHNPLFMDRIVGLNNQTVTWAGLTPADDIPYAEEIRRAMGNTRRIARRFNLVEMLPMPDLASTKYCLAKPGYVYVVYLPSGGEVEVDLRSVDGELKVEWMHPVDGSIMSAGTVLGGGWRSFKTPFTGDSVLILYR